MKQKTIQWLLAVALLISGSAAWAQGLPISQSTYPQLEVIDRYGDLMGSMPLLEGMMLYWPQTSRENIIDGVTSFVLCDKDGEPLMVRPMSELSYIKFLHVPAASMPADMSSYQAAREEERWNKGTHATFCIDGQSYFIAQPGELRFSSPLGSYELLTASGEHYTIPLAQTEKILYQDTIQGMAGYLDRILYEQGFIYQWCFFNGTEANTNKLYEDFYAMIPSGSSTNISLLVPTDEAFAHVPYIMSITCHHPAVIKIEKSANGKDNPPLNIGKILYGYDFYTGELSETPYVLYQLSESQLCAYLAQMLRSHTIMHRDEDRERGLYSGNEFYVALDGNPIRVIREDGQIVGFQSAYHLWNQQRGLTAMSGGSTASLTRANITQQRTKENGTIYCINNTLEATPSSVYSILSGIELEEGQANPFEKFFELCQMCNSKENHIFTNNGGLYDLGLDFIGNVPFTLYVPTNEAIEQEMGSVMSEIDNLYMQLDGDEVPEETSKELESQIQEKQALIMDFVKAHIHFGMEIADQLPFQRSHNTVLVKKENLVTPWLDVRGFGNGKMTVTDECGNTRNILDAHKNIFVREAHCTLSGKAYSPQGKVDLNNILLEGYAHGVIHQIDGVLRYNK